MARRMPTMRVFVALCAYLVSTSAFAVDFPPMDYLKATETFSVAKLSTAEVQEILKQVEADIDYRPETWQDELRIRRVRLGSVDGLVLQGLQALCGVTGNCTTWVSGENWGTGFRYLSAILRVPKDWGLNNRPSTGFGTSLQRNMVRRSSTCLQFGVLTAKLMSRAGATT
jgi:hypothetical protein